MNIDQVTSLVRSLMKIIGSALAAHGLTQAAGIVNGEDCIGVVLAIAGMVWSHWEHAADSAPPAGTNRAMLTWLMIAAMGLFGGSLMVSGCKSTPQQVAYQAAGTTAVTVETALAAYDQFAKAGKTTVAQNLAVKNAYVKYQAAFAVLCDAGAAYAASGGATNAPVAAALEQATANANQSINDVIALVQSFGVKLN